MRHIWFAAIACLLFGCAVAAPSVTPLDHLPSLTGQYFTIDSREAGHRYHIYVRYPGGYQAQASDRFPTVYLLDGDSLFPALAPMHRFLHSDDALPEAVLIGIAYGSFELPQNRRRHDFTRGASAFGKFLERELIPEVERRVRAAPGRRILVGQSRGGGFVLHSAFVEPDLFWGRIASNPTLDELPALKVEPAAAVRKDLRLFVASGNADEPHFREPLVRWFDRWQKRTNLPWALRTHTIDGGTHAADVTRAYRLGMGWLFSLPSEKSETP